MLLTEHNFLALQVHPHYKLYFLTKITVLLGYTETIAILSFLPKGTNIRFQSSNSSFAKKFHSGNTVFTIGCFNMITFSFIKFKFQKIN